MLRITHVILELIRSVAPIVVAIGRHDPVLARQLRDALNSTLQNTAEGSDQRGKRRTNHYAIALGSARESFVCLQAAEAWGFIELPAPIAASMNQVIGTLVRNVVPR